MRTETLNEFIVLAKHLSFVSAARELYISQPSLSTHIISLEKELGFNLFVRSGSVLYLTQAGSVFLRYAQRTLRELGEGIRKSAAVAVELPPVSIPSLPPSSPYYDALTRLEGHSFVFVDLKEGIPSFVAVEKGIVDAGIHFDYSGISLMCEQAEALGIAYIPAGTAQMSIAVMKSHPLAARSQITRQDLRGLKIAITSGAHFDSWKLLVLETIGEDLGLEFNLNQLRSIRNLAILDMGDNAHICGTEVIHECFDARDDVVIFDYLDGQLIQYAEGFVFKRANKQAEAFLQALVAEL
jgi:DNA-binding transcriptional LysR family regulator